MIEWMGFALERKVGDAVSIQERRESSVWVIEVFYYEVREMEEDGLGMPELGDLLDE